MNPANQLPKVTITCRGASLFVASGTCKGREATMKISASQNGMRNITYVCTTCRGSWSLPQGVAY